jgi:deoxyribodipyrimidine photo-lyase
MNKQEIALFWFRRDLRLDDNVGLFQALQSKFKVIPLFIFDLNILESLQKNDARVGFIHESLSNINQKLNEIGSSLLVKKGKTQEVWQELIQEFNIKEVFFNKDYEPYAIKRDLAISQLLEVNKSAIFTFKDQVIFEEKEITKADGLPYTIYTPYKNKWLASCKPNCWSLNRPKLCNWRRLDDGVC